MDRPHLDFICGQRAADCRVDPGEGKFLNRVGSPAQGDVERNTAAVFFQLGQKGALDFSTGHREHPRKGVSSQATEKTALGGKHQETVRVVRTDGRPQS
jgi:hypothetical protein